jgi:thiamine kinase-like enzyme
LTSETTTGIAVYAAGRLESILSDRHWLRPPLSAAIRDRLSDAVDSLETRWDVQRNAESFKTREPLSIVHGDIAPGNVLWRPEPVLIDWEYSRLGGPADGIAYTFDQNGLTAPQQEAFWRGYQQSASARGRLVDVANRIEWWERLTLLGSTIWWVERWVRRVEADASGTDDPAVPREQRYYLDHISSRTDRLERLLNGATRANVVGRVTRRS